MFSSITKYSPKNLLASYLSQSLAQFFDVDPTCVKSNLIQDAKVVLHDIDIKERILGGEDGASGLKVSGCIKQIEFSWVWDRKELIKDVRLVVNGVSVHVSVVEGDEKEAALSKIGPVKIETPAGSEVAGSTEAPPDWKAKYLNQVIDHLTVAVTNVTVAIHLDDESQVMLQAKDIELVTLMSSENIGSVESSMTATLMQMISLASIEIWIQQQGGEGDNKHPILEPFGYQASVTRLSGKRFLDGVLSGLIVEGKSSVNGSSAGDGASSTIRVHAGVKQIAGLNSLQRVLLAIGQGEDDEGVIENLPGDTNKEVGKSDSAEGAPAAKSVFHLPFQSMEVVLENNTALRLAACSIKYCTDGSDLSITCSEGIWVDDTPLSNDGIWILDLVSSELLLDSNPNSGDEGSDLFYSAHSDGELPSETENQPDEKPLRLNLSLDTFQRIYCGIQAIMPQCTEAEAIAEKVMDQYAYQPSSSSSSPTWSVRSTKPVSLRFTGKDSTWVEMIAKSPKLDGSSFECDAIDFGSNAGFAIHVPRISTDATGSILLEDSISATFDSLDTLKVLQSMWNQISDIIGDESSGSGLPVDVSLAGFDVTFKEPHLSTLHLSSIKGSGIEWSVALVQVQDVGDATLEASSLRVILDEQKTTMSVQRIKQLAYKNVDYLVAPIDDATLEMTDGMLSLSFSEVSVKYPDQALTAAEKNDNCPQDDPLAITMGLHVTVKHLKVESTAKGDVRIEGVNFSLKPTAEAFMLEMDLASTKICATDVMEFSCGKIISSAEINTTGGVVNDSAILIPGLEQYSLALASFTIHDVIQAQGATGSLAKPLDIVEITYDGQTAMVKCSKVLLEESSTKGHVHIEGVNFSIRPTAESFMLEMDLASTKVRAADMMEFSCGKIKSSTEITTAGSIVNDSAILIPGFEKYSLSTASVTIHDVIQAKASMGSLAKPLDIVEITYGSQTVMVKCNKVLLCSKVGEQNSQSTAAGDFSFNLPVAISFEFSRLVTMKEFGPGKPGLCCDGLSLHLKPTETATCVTTHCKSVQFRGENGELIAVKGVKMNLSGNLGGQDELLGLTEARLSIQEVSKVSVPGRFSLAKPLCNPVFILKNNFLAVLCNSVHVTYTQSGEQVIGKEQGQISAGSTDIPVPFSITVKQLIIDAPEAKASCNQFSIQYMKASATTPKSVRVGIASFNGEVGMDSCKLDGISISTRWQGVVDHENEIVVSNLGALSFAQAEIEACTEMTTGSFSLIEPMHKSKLLFQEGIVALELPEIQLDVTKSLSSEQSQLKDTTTSNKSNLDIIRVPIGINLGKLRLKAPTFDIHFDKIGVDYVRSSSGSQGEVFARCDRLIESVMGSAKKLDLSLRLSLLAADPQRQPGPMAKMIPGIDQVKKASLKIGEITNLFAQGKCRLSQPLHNMTMTYENGVVATDIESIQFESLSFEQNLTVGARKLSVRIQSDPFDSTMRLMIQSDTLSGHGHTSFGTSGVTLIATLVPANEEVIASKPISVPSLGYVSLIVFDAAEVPILSAKGIGHLQSPIKKLGVRFENDCFTLNCPSLHFERRSQSTPMKVTTTKIKTDEPVFELPCKTKISIGALQLRDPLEHLESSCKSLDMTFEPMAGLKATGGPGVRFRVTGSDIKAAKGSAAVDTPNLAVSGFMKLNDLVVESLAVDIKKAQLAAEFSSSSWSDSAGQVSPVVTRLPYAKISKFDLTLHYAGGLVSISDATVACDEYKGNVNTTLTQVKAHYMTVVTGRIPFLLANTDVAGCNVADSAGIFTGKVLTGASVVGATVGVVGRDAVGSALTMGKLSRGASSTDKYKFGDFTRGTVASVKHAAKSGSEMRGDDGSYQVGDLTSGTARAAGNYASDNRCRLAGAGGSAYGMLAGAALLGPVGLIAGSLIGGSVAKSSMTAIAGDPKKDRNEESQDSSNQSNTSAKQDFFDQAPDLLSSDNVDSQPRGFYNQPSDLLSSGNVNLVARGASQQQRSPGVAPVPSSQYGNRQTGSHAQYPANRSHYQQASAPPAEQNFYNQTSDVLPPAPPTAQRGTNSGSNQQGYRFGDMTRGAVAKGKKAEGRDENSGYKFGDFSRGLFK